MALVGARSGVAGNGGIFRRPWRSALGVSETQDHRMTALVVLGTDESAVHEGHVVFF